MHRLTAPRKDAMSEWIECFGRKPDLPDGTLIQLKWNDGAEWLNTRRVEHVAPSTWRSLTHYRLAVDRPEPSCLHDFAHFGDCSRCGLPLADYLLDKPRAVRECEHGNWVVNEDKCGKCGLTGLQILQRGAVREGKQVNDQRGAAAKEADACRPCVRPPEQSAPHLTREQYENLHGPKREPAFVFSRDRFGFLVRHPELREVTRHADDLPWPAYREWRWK